MKHRLTAPALGLLIGLAACGSSHRTASDGAVHPFDEIRSSEVTFEPDSTDPSREIVHVTTNVPTICAFVWGVDDHFGHFDNSLAMKGTGITQHDVILPGVAPGTTYRYEIEGVTADGTLYRSPVGTFTVPATPATPSSTAASLPGKDITSRGTVSAFSSQYSSDFAATNAIDGNPATEWATKGDGDHGSITLDLGTATDITGVQFVTRSMADGTAITDTYTVSIDGAAPLGPFPAATVAHPNPVPITAHGRTIRFDLTTTTGGNVGAVDIHVYG